VTRAEGPPAAKAISIRPLQSDDGEPYRRFCEELFGRDAYQGRSTYLDWLYEDNPVARGLDDCLVATDPSGAIVGCIHRLRLPWQIEGRVAIIPSLHNLMIAEAFRGGAGFFMLTRAVKGESHALIPGVTGPLAQAYARMGYQRLDTRWYRRVVRTDRAVAQTLLHRLGRSRSGRLRSERIARSTSGLVVTASPDDVTVAEVAAALNENAGSGIGVAHVDWSAELVQWRFFAPRGPRHVLARDLVDGAFAIVSVGPRHGVTVARILAWSPIVLSSGFLARLGRMAVGLGASVLLAYDARPNGAETLSIAGLQPMRSPPMSFLYSRDKRPLTIDLDGGGTDLGFEALPDDVI
jgi:hypothetical protein